MKSAKEFMHQKHTQFTNAVRQTPKKRTQFLNKNGNWVTLLENNDGSMYQLKGYKTRII